MSRRASLRASDADREHIAERLRKAAAEGRILTEELEHRLMAAFSARTYGELEPLVADLPGARGRRARPRRSAVHSRAFAFPVGLLLPLLLFALVLAGTGHPPFPLFPILFFVLFRFGSRRRHPYR